MIVSLSKPGLIRGAFNSVNQTKLTPDMTRSTVGVGGYAALDQTYRSSFCSTVNTVSWVDLMTNSDETISDIEALICSALCKDKDKDKDKDKCKCNDKMHVWQFTSNSRKHLTFSKVVYRVGDHFKKHTDTKNDLTLIVIPAGTYEAGILHIYNGDIKHSFKSDPVNDQIVIFSAYLLHESTEVTSGSKLIYKTSLSLYSHLVEDAIKLVCPDPINITTPVDTSSLKERLNEEINRLKIKLATVQAEKDAIDNNTLTNKIISWIGQLPGPVESTDITEVKNGHVIVGESDGEVQLFLREISEKFNIRKIRGFVQLTARESDEYDCRISLNMGEEGISGDLDEHCYTYLQTAEDIERIVTDEDYKPNHLSVYNDQDYNNLSVYQVALYLINRK